jgi:hypothetical protein
MNLNTILIHHKKPVPFWYHKYASQLETLKRLIDEDENAKLWDSAKKYTNPYELIYSPYHSLQNHIILRKRVLSRAYYKFYEIMIQNRLDIYYKEKIQTFHIAEGPGGFIQAWNDHRKSMGFTDDIYGITLKDDKDKHIRGWDCGRKYFKRNPNISVDYGVNGTGDLFNEDNIKYIQDKFATKKADLVTGDGGFDFSGDFCSQETNSFPLLFIQCYLALQTQANLGCFVLKVFDLFETPTIQLMEMVAKCYETFILLKPKTSRPANSEKYILFTGFKGLTRDDNIRWTNLLRQILDYQGGPENVGYIHRIHMGTINSNFCDKLSIELSPFLTAQIENFNITHRMIHLMKLNVKEELDRMKTELRETQLQKANEWITSFHSAEA